LHGPSWGGWSRSEPGGESGAASLLNGYLPLTLDTSPPVRRWRIGHPPHEGTMKGRDVSGDRSREEERDLALGRRPVVEGEVDPRQAEAQGLVGGDAGRVEVARLQPDAVRAEHVAERGDAIHELTADA